MTSTTTPCQLELELAAFTGSEQFWRHPIFRRVLYTEGVRYLAEAAEAFWLIDELAGLAISREMAAAAEANSNLRSMQFWTLTVDDCGVGDLFCEDGNGLSSGVRMTIPWTDFPLPEIRIWAAWDGEHWTLYLPSEH